MLSISTYLNESFYKNVGTDDFSVTLRSFDKVIKGLHYKSYTSMQKSQKVALCDLLVNMVKGTVITVRNTHSGETKYMKRGEDSWTASYSDMSAIETINISSISILYAMSNSIYKCKKEPELTFE